MRFQLSKWAMSLATGGLFASPVLAGDWGIWDTYIIANTDGANSGGTLYRTAFTINISRPRWQDQSFGVFNAGGAEVSPGSLTLNGAQVFTYKNNGGDVTGAFIGYRVTLASNPSGTYTQTNLGFGANLANPGDQRWESNGLNIKVLNYLAAGAYQFEVYTGASGNNPTATYYVNNGSNNYIALFTVAASTFLWDGGGGNGQTSADANWSRDIRPGDGHILQFAGNSQTAVTNSLSSAKGIAFNALASPFTVGGSAISIGSDGVANNSSNLQTINANVTLSAPQTFASGTNGLKFGGSVDLNGNGLTVSGSAGTFSGNITGSGSVTLNTTGTTRFEGSGNSYSGTTSVTAGKLLVSGTKSGAGDVTVSNSAVLGGSGSIAGNININNTATITGGDVGTFGKLTATGTGNVTLASTSTFRLDIGSNAGSPGTAGVHFDQIALTGSGKTIYLGGSNLVFSINWPVVVNQAYKIIDATGNTVSGTFAGLNLGNNYEYSLPGTLNGVRFKINYGSDSVNLTFTAVPEPASLSLVSGAIGLAMGRRNCVKKRIRR